MKPIFKYKEDRLPVAIIVSIFVVDLILYFTVTNVFVLIGWVILMTIPKFCICAWNHHHQHVPTFRPKSLNRLLEGVYAFHTGMTTNTWVLHHVLGHHVNYLDQSKDESRWKTVDGDTMGRLEYTLNVALTGYTRAYDVGRRYPRYQKTLLRVGVVVLILLAAMIWYNPTNAIILFALPMLVGYVGTCWATYTHHAGLETENQYEASYNITHSFFNLCTGNLGYHTAHHVKQGVHWSKLPEFHATIADKIPAHLYRKPFLFFRLFPDRSNDLKVVSDGFSNNCA